MYFGAAAHQNEKLMQAKYKSQHFVPKCYLRNFASDPGRKRINIFNIKNTRTIPNASISDQCARDFFYDRDGKTDAMLGNWETIYGSIISTLQRQGAADADDLLFLRYFSCLQHLRTESVAKQKAAMMTEMRDHISADFAESPIPNVNPKLIPRQSIKDFLSTFEELSDLSDCIVYNKTDLNFITSDNPSVAVNRFHVQKKRSWGGAGIRSAGFMMFLPLSPTLCFVTYDHGVYSPRLSAANTAFAERKRDVQAINSLQFIRSDENIYYDTGNLNAYVSSAFDDLKERRPPSWHSWHFAVKDASYSIEGYERYRHVATVAEIRQANSEALIHLKARSVEPASWCSIFGFRFKPRFHDTHSAAGLLRSAPSNRHRS